jgi:hypothetical protein
VRPLTIVPVQDACERPVSSLDSQIAELKSRRRSPIEFDEWKPSPFYYLYAPVGALLVYFLTGPPWLGLGKLAATGLCFGFLCYLPVIYNRLRFWLFFRWPNKRLHRRIASLEAQMNHQSASGGQGA